MLSESVLKALDDDDDFVLYDHVDDVELELAEPVAAELDGDDSALALAGGRFNPAADVNAELILSASLFDPAEAPSDLGPLTAKRQRVVPFVRQFKRTGTRGRDVLAVQRALRRAQRVGGGEGATIPAASGIWGGYSRRALIELQKRKGLEADGVYGRATHRALSWAFDARGIALLRIAQDAELKRHDVIAPEARPLAAESCAILHWNHRWHIRYTQSWLRMDAVKNEELPPDVPEFDDCSSSNTTWLWTGGYPDPNGGIAYTVPRKRGPGSGYTGTMIRHGVRGGGHARAKSAFYGRSGITHVAMGVGNAGRVVTNGHYPMDLTRADYRSDLQFWHRYPVGR
jgi:hypothetical protein